MKKCVLVAAVLVLGVATSGRARAETLSFDSSGGITLRYVSASDPNAVTLTAVAAQTQLDEQTKTGSGSVQTSFDTRFAAADTSSTPQLNPGESIVLQGRAFGSLPGAGSAAADARTIGALQAANASGADVTVSLVFERTWSLATVGGTGTLGTGVFLTADNNAGPIFAWSKELSGLAATFSGSDTYTYDWVIPANGNDQIVFQTQACGSVAPVPEPSTSAAGIALLGCAAFGRWLKSKRRKTA